MTTLNNNKTIKEKFMDYVMDKYDFDRARELDGKFEEDFINYEAFLDWNKECLIQLKKEDLKLLEKLMRMIDSRTLRIMDMEDLQEWKASGMYYNMDSELVIYHPR